MKILILTVTAGEGHNSTAAAVKDSLEAKGMECEVLDTCRRINRGLYNIIAKGYLLATADFKKAYAWVYARLENRKSNSFTPSFTRATYRMVKRRIIKHIEEYKPDVIVYTHIFAGVLLDVIAEKHPLPARTVGIVTDFVMHPFWEETLHTDRVVIANEMLLPAARRKGLREDQLLPIGIPIRPQFSKSIPQREARERLGLDPNRPTVLLMGGSMGYGTLAKTVAELDEAPVDCQMICVCGRNEKAKAAIDAIDFKKKVLNLGYTDQISLLMDASDCIVSKPGGLTTSEALAKRLPIVISNPIPGQEDRNADFLLNNGVAAKVTKAARLSDVLYQLFMHPERIDMMKASIDLIRKPNATEDLAAAIAALPPKNPGAREAAAEEAAEEKAPALV